MVQQVKASEFRSKCFALLDHVARTGRTVVITKKGKPIADLAPHRAREVRSPFGIWKGSIRITGDIVSAK